MTDRANDKRSPIIAGALLLTAVFLGVFGWLLSRTDTCTQGWWLWDRLACLEPNALGDTFAGAFAPVAFVWLVAAVMLQRNELAAQRQELRLTREEFALTRQEVEGQRRAMEAQVVEARRNAEFIGKQTKILEAQRKREESRFADEQIDIHFHMLARDLASVGNWLEITVKKEELGVIRRETFKILFAANRDATEVEAIVRSQINGFDRRISGFYNIDGDWKVDRVEGLSELRKLGNTLESMLEVSLAASRGKQDEIYQVGVNDLGARVSKLIRQLEDALVDQDAGV